jgi:hypothetical protein
MRGVNDTQRGTLAAVGAAVLTVGATGLQALLLADTAPRWFRFGVALSLILVVAGAAVCIKALNAAQFFRDLGFALVGGAVLGLLVGAFARNVDAGLWSGLGFAVLLYIATLPPVRRWLPTPILERGAPSQGPALRFRPPEARGKKRLQQETFALVRDIRDYVNSRPDPSLLAISSFQETLALDRDDSLSQAEKTRIYRERLSKEMEDHAQEGRELEERFGGRVRYVVQEYLRRRMLTDNDAKVMESGSSSLHWIRRTAVHLEALARSL